jgi:hypothetical protein
MFRHNRARTAGAGPPTQKNERPGAVFLSRAGAVPQPVSPDHSGLLATPPIVSPVATLTHCAKSLDHFCVDSASQVAAIDRVIRTGHERGPA